jgi:hypothetical protein
VQTTLHCNRQNLVSVAGIRFHLRPKIRIPETNGPILTTGEKVFCRAFCIGRDVDRSLVSRQVLVESPGQWLRTSRRSHLIVLGKRTLDQITVMSPTRSDLRKNTESLATAFANKASLEDIISHFSTTHQTTCIEHGLERFAPFLGRPFNDPRKYFTLISTLIDYGDMSFSEYVIDTEARKACVKGRARFTMIETGQSWDECFIWMLDFDEEAKVTDYQVWADTGACYLAREGKLGAE